MKTVRYHEAAEQELLTELGYLELRTKGLGRRFLAEVRRAVSFIAEFPEAAEQIGPGIRRCLLRKFRYALIYTAEGNELIVLAVAHTSRRPGYWMERIEEDSK